jgi:membrane protein DedA with SNARE-associated domain
MVIEWIRYLLINYGYPALFIGTFLDSEASVLVLGGIAARLGYLDLYMVMCISYLGVFLGDQLYFFLGRWKAGDILSHFPRLEQGVIKIKKKMGRHKIIKILMFRFILGLRIPAPLFLGMSEEVSYARFFFIDSLMLAPWAVGLCSGGYLVGGLLKRVLTHITQVEYLIIGGIIVIFLLIWLIKKLYTGNQL